MKKPKSRAQSFIMYAFLLAIVVGAFIAIRTYLMRTVQEKYRQTADVFGGGEQYAKGVTLVRNMDSAGVTPPNGNGITPDLCSNLVAETQQLELEVPQERANAQTNEQSATKIEATLRYISNPARRQEISDLAAGMRTEAARLRAEATSKETEAANNRRNYPDCFSSPPQPAPAGPCTAEVTDKSNSSSEALADWSKANFTDSSADQIELSMRAMVCKDDRNCRSAVRNTIQTLITMRNTASDLRTQARTKYQHVIDLLSTHPECFSLCSEIVGLVNGVTGLSQAAVDLRNSAAEKDTVADKVEADAAEERNIAAAFTLVADTVQLERDAEELRQEISDNCGSWWWYGYRYGYNTDRCRELARQAQQKEDQAAANRRNEAAKFRLVASYHYNENNIRTLRNVAAYYTSEATQDSNEAVQLRAYYDSNRQDADAIDAEVADIRNRNPSCFN